MPPASPRPISSASSEAPEPTVHKYWCEEPGQSTLVRFADIWVLGLVDNKPKAKLASRTGYDVAVPGLCPFHVIAHHNPNDSVDCGGVNTHVHEAVAGGDTVPWGPLVLNMPLVTYPMPLSALLMSDELRRVSLYYYRDFVLPGGLAQITPQAEADARYSIDAWTNKICHENILLHYKGPRVPCPQNRAFRADPELYQISLAFWTPFQQKMWRRFLKSDNTACFLDAVYRCDRDGFQLWTLFYDSRGQIVPVSYLLTTGTTRGLVSDWLSEIEMRSQALLCEGDAPSSPVALPAKTMFVNSMKLISPIAMIFGSWKVQYAKYYIDQELKYIALKRSNRQLIAPDAIAAVRRADVDFAPAVRAIKATPELERRLDYLFDNPDAWSPRTPEDMTEFQRTSEVISRWRYLLWMTMQSRPTTTRVDSVIYFLIRKLNLGVKQVIDSQKAIRGSLDMRPVERTSGMCRGDLAGARTTILDGSLIALWNNSKTEPLDTVIDKEFGVCFCPEFAEHSLCAHLIYCSTTDIHQPWLARMLDHIPSA
ncbi:hypothetical protein GGF46_000628 [Coemansia sp. RSA 552]|nr:hypothetical protein GGF46_000628 [Coemansia sp. RSA 552]